jgi:flavin reductase (DIM6/NTAB) family NADH-FMN oxidoreductase RutF
MHYVTESMPRDIGAEIWSTIIAPRPVFLVATQSEDGIDNIAPFTSISCVANHPPMIAISFGERSSMPKYTLQNILYSKIFTLNVVSFSMLNAANMAAEGVDRQDDFTRLGLGRREFLQRGAFGIAESPASILCETTDSFMIEGTRCTLALAKCKEVIVDNCFVSDGLLKPIEADFVASIGSEEYMRVKGETFHLPRLWA